MLGGVAVMECQIVYAGLSGAPLHCVPDYVGSHAANSVNNSAFQDSSEYFSVADSRVPAPSFPPGKRSNKIGRIPEFLAARTAIGNR